MVQDIEIHFAQHDTTVSSYLRPNFTVLNLGIHREQVCDKISCRQRKVDQ